MVLRPGGICKHPLTTSCGPEEEPSRGTHGVFFPLNEANEPTLSLQTSELSKSNLMKTSWLKKFGNCTPNRSFQIQSSPARPTSFKDLESCRRRSAPAPCTPKRIPVVPGSPLEMPDLESIIREFEMGYLSPTKHEPVECTKQGNFVKKIVAAFEVKYKAYNDFKDEQELKDSRTEASQQSSEERFEKEEIDTEADGTREPAHSSPKNSKRRSGFFASPFKDSRSAEKCDAAAEKDKKRSGLFSTPCSKEQKGSRRSGFFLSPFRLTQDTPKSAKSGSSSPIQNGDKSSKELDVTVAQDECNVSEVTFDTFSPLKISDDSKSTPRKQFDSTSSLKSMDDSKSTDSGVESPLRMLRINSASSTQDSTSSSPCASPDQGPKSPDSGSSSPFKFADQDSGCADREFLISSPFRTTHDDTRSVRSIDLSISLPDADEATLLWEDQHAEGQHNLTINVPSVSSADKTPKIVGAFLKKPIEVEDTSVDWIPITGKKLPRKRSLKKLLSMLTRKKTLDRKSKILFRSERNLCEESRELQDSGYDEKSCSSSSLTSLVSISDILLRSDQSGTRQDDRSNTILRTFRSDDCLKDEEEMCGPSLKDLKKKLFLTEISREELKLDLGPSYPSSSLLSMSLDRRALPKRTPSRRSPAKPTDDAGRLPKHPFLSKIPKHPFVALTKHELNADCGLLFEEHETFVRNDPVDVTTMMNPDADDEHGVTIRNDLYEVEFRRSPEDIRSTASCRSSTSDESIYDIPRPFISRSESEIPKMFRQATKNGLTLPIYDVPKSGGSSRPKSSLYDDALSLKRRTGTINSVPDFYSVPADEEPHYATVNPRKKRICLSEEMLRSCRDLSTCEKSSSPF